jgi:hypothetical protein
MTKRQIARSSFDDEHKRLRLACRNARGGERIKAQQKLEAYVRSLLKGPR